MSVTLIMPSLAIPVAPVADVLIYNRLSHAMFNRQTSVKVKLFLPHRVFVVQLCKCVNKFFGRTAQHKIWLFVYII